MKYQDNIEAVASLQPDYLGFIFHEESPRNFDGLIPELPKNIQKVGVFVDEKIEFISNQMEKHKLSVIQLHGHESPEICRILKSTNAKVIQRIVQLAGIAKPHVAALALKQAKRQSKKTLILIPFLRIYKA